MQVKHILLTTDLSEEALRPFGPVLELARNLSAKVTVLHVVPELQVVPHGAPFAPPITMPDVGKEIESARASLEEQCKDMRDGLELEVDAISGQSSGKSIVAYADSHDIDLIALSTHGRTGFRRLALGSVAEEVLRHSHVPVLSFPRAKNA